VVLALSASASPPAHRRVTGKFTGIFSKNLPRDCLVRAKPSKNRARLRKFPRCRTGKNFATIREFNLLLWQRPHLVTAPFAVVGGGRPRSTSGHVVRGDPRWPPSHIGGPPFTLGRITLVTSARPRSLASVISRLVEGHVAQVTGHRAQVTGGTGHRLRPPPKGHMADDHMAEAT
jgi:hypothetical protein